MASIISMLVSLSAISFCLSLCKAVLHSYIPIGITEHRSERWAHFKTHRVWVVMENYTWSTFHVNNHWFDATQFLLRLREVYKTVKYNHVAESRKTVYQQSNCFEVMCHAASSSQVPSRYAFANRVPRFSECSWTRPVAENWKGEHHRQGGILFLQNLNNK